MEFKLISKNKPAGDQPKAIKALVSGLNKKYPHQTLLGVTGSGKTFTIANVIAETQKPTLVIAHNKTLAAQLCNELRELFPNNAVNYFVSYYDYYQPEAYMPASDTYIGKEAMINDEIDKLRHAATASLLTRQDVIIVASVSCIYGLGAPETYAKYILNIKTGDKISRQKLIKELVNLQFTRTNYDLKRTNFRVRGDNWEIMPPDREIIYSFSLKNDIIQEIYEVNPIKGFEPDKTPVVSQFYVAPAKHFITELPDRKKAVVLIKKELKDRLKYLEERGKLLEAERLEHRTMSDLAMIQEIGYCNGIENYSRHLSGRGAGEPPATLLDYFPNDFLTVIDESHVTVPQLNGMYEGDASRKKTLIEYGFRLPSAADNRPLKFAELQNKLKQIIYTSATPALYECHKSQPASPAGGPASPAGGQIVPQIIRPTGLVDPKITIRPAKGQINDLLSRLDKQIKNKERVLITTLTKKMAEDLSAYLEEKKFKAVYLHSDIKTIERIKILTNLRKGKFDVLVGVNLLREGLDLPEVSLVAILDADKEGFLRSETSLIQTIGRAARNVNGEVLLYADQITGSIKRAVAETEKRRELQLAYNKKYGITPQTIKKEIKDILPEDVLKTELAPLIKNNLPASNAKRSFADWEKIIKEKEIKMKKAANNLSFELAAILRDEIKIMILSARSTVTKSLSPRRRGSRK